MNPQKSHKYLTIVMDIQSGAVVYVEGKGAQALDGFWKRLKAAHAPIEAVAIDMSTAYYQGGHGEPARRGCGDRLVPHRQAAEDKLSDLRRDLYREGTDRLHKDVVKDTRWLPLKRPENLDETRHESKRLQEALRLNENLVTAYCLKEDLTLLWEQPHKQAAGRFLDDWIRQAEASGILVLTTFARTLAIYRSGILAWYDHPISTGPLEDTNNTITMLKRQAHRFRYQEYFKLKIKALHHTGFELIG